MNTCIFVSVMIVIVIIIIITRKGSNCECIATWRPHDIAAAPVVLGCFDQLCRLLCMHTKCYLPSCNQHSDSAIRFIDSDSLKKSNNSAIRRCYHAVTLTSDTWPWTFVVDCVSSDVMALYKCCYYYVSELCIRREQNRAIRGCGRVVDHLVNFSTFSLSSS